MFGLEKIADAFDRMHADVQRDYDRAIEKERQVLGKAYGPDNFLTYSTMMTATVSWALGTFVMASGKSLVDVLRLGDGVRSWTAWGFAQDGLRVLNLVPVVSTAAKGVGMSARAITGMRMASVAGQQGAMSCGPTAIAAAARVSGQNVTMTLETVGNELGTIHPNAANFPGMYLEEVKDVLKATSLANEELNLSEAGIEAVEAAAAQGKGPVIFGVQYWQKTAGGIVQPQTMQSVDRFGRPIFDGFGKPVMGGNLSQGLLSAPDHWMTAFRSATGRIMVADQFSVRPISEVANIGGSTAQFTLSNTALVVSDGVVLRGLSAAAAPVTSVSSAKWLAGSVGLNMVVVNAPTIWQMDAGLQDQMGKQPREWPGMPPGTLRSKPGSGNGAAANTEVAAPQVIPRPNLLSRTLQQDSMLVLSKLPQNGDSREFFQLVKETGLSNDRVRDALLQLLNSGMVSTQKWFKLNGKETPVSVRRSFRR